MRRAPRDQGGQRLRKVSLPIRRRFERVHALRDAAAESTEKSAVLGRRGAHGAARRHESQVARHDEASTRCGRERRRPHQRRRRAQAGVRKERVPTRAAAPDDVLARGRKDRCIVSGRSLADGATGRLRLQQSRLDLFGAAAALTFQMATPAAFAVAEAVGGAIRRVEDVESTLGAAMTALDEAAAALETTAATGQEEQRCQSRRQEPLERRHRWLRL